MKLEQTYQEMWKAVIQMQDLREDLGHAETVLEFAIILAEKVHADKKIVIPAAIFHDTGYFSMDKNLLKELMAGKLSPELSKKLKEEHMQRGAKVARDILLKLGYEEHLIEEIARIVERHDSDAECKSVEEKIVRDADKLWRFSKKGFNVDVKRRGCKKEEWAAYLERNIEKEGYFYTEEAREIARQEIEKRKN